MALIDLRAEGHTAENRLGLLLADLFHNIPLPRNLVERADLAPEDVLRWLRARARRTPMEAWLKLREQEIMQDGQDERDATQRDDLPGGGTSS